jgi:anthranilate phosphoribosyltransferase
VENGTVREMEIHPADIGAPLVSLEELRGGEPSENAERLRSVLNGAEGALRQAVVLNSAGALWICGLAADLKEAASMAKEVLDSGKALAKLRELIALTSEPGAAT